MDRNQVIGLVLMLLMVTVYFQYFAPEPPVNEEIVNEQVQEEETKPARDTISQLPDSAEADKIVTIDSLPLQKKEQEYLTIENEDIVITFGNLGGVVTDVVLKKHKNYDKEALQLIHREDNSFALIAGQTDLNNLFFETTSKSGTIKKGDTIRLVYESTVNGVSIQKSYSIPGKGYQIKSTIKTSGINRLTNEPYLQYQWSNKLARLERDLKDARNRTTIKYRTLDDDIDELSKTSVGLEEENIEQSINWVTFKQKFFSSGIIAKTSFPSGYISTNFNEGDESYNKYAFARLTIPVNEVEAPEGFQMEYYYGPNNYQIIKKVAPDFSENVYLGWGIFSWVNKFLIIPIFQFLENFIGNYGIIIMIMVIIIRIILAPLTFKSHMSMAKMKVLKPELDVIKEKHGDDMQKAQSEQMQLYQKVGINPLSGCIPMVLQIPILLAMFNFFPNSIELRQQSFLWADDLSTYDSILDLPFTIPFYGDHVSLFTLLMAASTILYTWSNSQVTSIQGPMKTMQYIMPVMLLFFLNNYSSGLTFYYFVSNISSFGLIALFKKFVDEDKIKKALDENRKKNANKKKSSFQQRLEEAMKTREEQKKKVKKK